MMSDHTADRLDVPDDAAVWGAIARQDVLVHRPVLIHLPTFAGDRDHLESPMTLADRSLTEYASERARSFTPWEDEDLPDDEIAEMLAASYADTESHYQWYLRERAAKVRWLDELRAKFVHDLIQEGVSSDDPERVSTLNAQQWGSFLIVVNEAGGRAGRVRDDLELLLLGSEFDRPAAISALATAGYVLPFDPSPGWLNASVVPSRRGWLAVVRRFVVAGMDFDLELARFDTWRDELTVYVAELKAPVEALLRRVGFPPAAVLVGYHPDDPEYLFGADVIRFVEEPLSPRHRPRRLRVRARELLPPLWAELIEKTWCPPNDGADLPEGLFKRQGGHLAGLGRKERAGGGGPQTCRLCDSGLTAKSNPYCSDCYADAADGLFVDQGFNEPWNDAVIWSLRTLAEIEFGGPPAREQLAKAPVQGDSEDLLMLCRMLTARHRDPALGSERKSYAWTDWLARAGLLVDGERRSRGVTVVAKDGHLCRSMFEKQIDDFFHDSGIAHEPEPHYPFDPEMNTTGYRADWKLSDGTFVEALGFTKNSDYMAKVQRKLALAGRHQISVITVTETDLVHLKSIFRRWTV